jgi:hypothetical protein
MARHASPFIDQMPFSISPADLTDLARISAIAFMCSIRPCWPEAWTDAGQSVRSWVS